MSFFFLHAFHSSVTKLSPNFQQTFNKPLPNFQQTFSKLPTNFHQTFAKLLANFPQTSNKLSPNFAKLHQISNKLSLHFHQTFTKLSSNFPTNFWQFFKIFNKKIFSKFNSYSSYQIMTLTNKQFDEYFKEKVKACKFNEPIKRNQNKPNFFVNELVCLDFG
jgi:hypothetical protein